MYIHYMQRIIIIIVLLALVTACNNYSKQKPITAPKRNGYLAYRNDEHLTYITGQPKKEQIYYLPENTFADTYWVFSTPSGRMNSARRYEQSKEDLCREWNILPEQIKDTLIVDKPTLELCSNNLKALNEPILYNYYLGKKIFRLTNIPGIAGEYFSITVSQENDSFYISSKIRLRCSDSLFRKIPKADSNGIITYKKAQISYLQFRYVDSLTKMNNLISQSYYSDSCTSFDAEGYLLEVHTDRGYYYFFRWGPRSGTLWEIIKKISELSGIRDKEQLIYRLIYKF